MSFDLLNIPLLNFVTNLSWREANKLICRLFRWSSPAPDGLLICPRETSYIWLGAATVWRYNSLKPGDGGSKRDTTSFAGVGHVEDSKVIMMVSSALGVHAAQC